MNPPNPGRGEAQRVVAGPLFETMAIIGVGLIGGSLARAARERGLVSRIVGMGRGQENLRKAVDLGVIDSMETDWGKGLRNADLVVIATPVESIVQLLPRIAPLCGEDALVTDVGSVKAAIVEEAERTFSHPGRFVGGHPIAGTENSGVEASFASLFTDRKTILTPTERTDTAALDRLRRLWEEVGSNVVIMDTENHDRVMGFVSHLPHIVAYALVHTVYSEDQKEGNLARFSAGGFLDFTRIASSHPEMWRDICLMNRESLMAAVDSFSTTLERFKALISAGDGRGLEEHFARCKQTRAQLLNTRK
jgi:prephenate dehydrogenase